MRLFNQFVKSLKQPVRLCLLILFLGGCATTSTPAAPIATPSPPSGATPSVSGATPAATGTASPTETPPPRPTSSPPAAPTTGIDQLTALSRHQLARGVVDRVAFSPAANLLAVAFRDKGLGLYETGQFTEIDFIELNEQVSRLVFSPDGTILAGGLRGKVMLWGIDNDHLAPHQTFDGLGDGWLEGLDFSPNGAILAAGGWSNVIWLWQVADGQVIRQIEAAGQTKSLQFSPDGTTLATGDVNGVIRLWQVADGALLNSFGGGEQLTDHTWGVTYLAFSPDGAQLAATSPENLETHIWRVSDGELLHILRENTDFVNGYIFSSDGRTLITIRAGINLWNVTGETLLHQEDIPGTFLAGGGLFLPETLLTVTVKGLVQRWSLSAAVPVDSAERPPAATPAASELPVEALTHFEKGKTAYTNNNYEAVIAEMTAVINLTPDYLDAYHYRASAYYRLEMYDEMLLDMAKMIDLDPQNAAFYHDRAQIYNFLERYEEALSDYNKALELQPDFTEVYFARGRVYQNIGQVENSIEDYRRFLDLSGDDQLKERYFATDQIEQMTAAMSKDEIMAQYEKGKAALEAGDYEVAITALTYVVDYDPGLTDAQFLRGQAKVMRSIELNTLLDLTRFDLIKTIERDPNNAEAHYYLGLAHLQNEIGTGKASQEALAEFEQTLQLDPGFVSVHQPQGLAYLYTQQYRPAIDSFSRAIAVEPDNPQLYLWRGWAYQEVEAQTEAIADFERYLQTGTDPFWRNQAEIQLALLSHVTMPLSPEMVDRYQQAKQEFLTLLRYTDETYMSQEFKDRYDAVIADFTAVIQADMSRPEPYVRRGLTYYMLKKYEESLRDFDAAISLAPEYALLHYYRGLANTALEQDNQALNDYNQAIALDPTFSKPYYTRGLIYRDQQAPQKAMADFAQYLELDNDKNLARQEDLFFITLIPLGDFITQAQEQLDSLNSSADMPATEQE